MSAGAAGSRRNRWALSFADLTLLLLGYFVLLQASGGHRDEMIASVSRHFGAQAPAPAIELRATDLFERGEALLSLDGRHRLAAVARRFAHRAGTVELRSTGSDPVHQRFDQWDLAAARLGAVARALRADGIDGRRVILRGLDQADSKDGKGQVIRISLSAG
ncbi:MAG: flagellar motor protein [Sphingobium sp.]